MQEEKVKGEDVWVEEVEVQEEVSVDEVKPEGVQKEEVWVEDVQEEEGPRGKTATVTKPKEKPRIVFHIA